MIPLKENREYLISESGEIFSLKRGKFLKKEVREYERVQLSHKGVVTRYLVHRLVASNFIGDIPKRYVVNHKDGNKLNNHRSNLEIVTYSRNFEHAKEKGLWETPLKYSDIKAVDSNNTELHFKNSNEVTEFLDINHKSFYHVSKAIRKGSKYRGFNWFACVRDIKGGRDNEQKRVLPR